jgi:Tol biopolymer transport system component
MPLIAAVVRGRYNRRRLERARTMADPSSTPTPDPAEVRLDSWKEIAAYLKRDITTVQRWERREGMPIHRHVHDKLGSVYAFRSQLDAWARSRAPAKSAEQSDTEWVQPQPTLRPTRWWTLSIAAVVLTVGVGWWLLDRSDYFWRNPLTGARFQTVTDFAGTEQAAAISRDGRFVAFVSNRDGRTDVWVTQIGVGLFYNLTGSRVSDLVNPSVRTLGFSPDGGLVTFWTRKGERSEGGDISVDAVPTLGGEPRSYLDGGAEYEWSPDGLRLVYHTPGPGDPMFVREASQRNTDRQIYAATAGRHAHFPIWSRDGAFIYFVQGSLPEAMDIWRIRSTGGAAEQITHHNSRVSHPVFVNARTLMYLASGDDGSGPWLHSIDVDRRTPHRVGDNLGNLDRYTSLSASADGRRLVATLANTHGTLWRLPIADTPVDDSVARPIVLSTARGFSPRTGPGYLLYVSSKGTGDGIWKLANGGATELWSAPDARVIGGPELAPDDQRVAFSVDQGGRTLLYTMSVDGTNVRLVTGSLELRGAPAWSPDGRSIVSGVNVGGIPHLFRIPLEGAPVPFVREYAVDPVWSPRGDFLVYSGADVGTTFPLKAVNADAGHHAIPRLTLTRGARRLRFLPGRPALLVMRGEIQHKNLWLIDLDTGSERQLTDLSPAFNIRDFDVSADGREIVVERVQEQSDIVLIELGRD